MAKKQFLVVGDDADNILSALNADNSNLLGQWCPNKGAYACDRRVRTKYIIFRDIPEYNIRFGDVIVAETGGNLARGDTTDLLIRR